MFIYNIKIKLFNLLHAFVILVLPLVNETTNESTFLYISWRSNTTTPIEPCRNFDFIFSFPSRRPNFPITCCPVTWIVKTFPSVSFFVRGNIKRFRLSFSQSIAQYYVPLKCWWSHTCNFETAIQTQINECELTERDSQQIHTGSINWFLTNLFLSDVTTKVKSCFSFHFIYSGNWPSFKCHVLWAFHFHSCFIQNHKTRVLRREQLCRSRKYSL